MIDRGTLIGEATAGSSGTTLVIQLLGGFENRVCSSCGFYPDGTDFIGKGVILDIEVKSTLRDFRTG